MIIVVNVNVKEGLICELCEGLIVIIVVNVNVKEGLIVDYMNVKKGLTVNVNVKDEKRSEVV